jgi:aminopeptidase-like protein
MEEKSVTLKKHNLHIVNYSIPIHKKISFKELSKHLHTLPNKPNAIPYVTSYYNYKENWGFCITYDEYKTLPQSGEYEVFIDSRLENGHLTYGDVILEGDRKDEILFFNLCMPSKYGK